LHAGEVQTLYNGRTMDLVKFREKFDGRQTPAGDGRRKPRSMPRGRRQVRSVAGWAAEPRSKTGQTARGPPRPGTEGKSPGETGDCRRRRRTAKAPVEANDGRRELRSMPGRTARGLPRPGTNGKSPGRRWRRTAKSRPMPGSDGRSPGQNRRRPLILCRNVAMGLGLFSRKTGEKQFLRYSR